MLRITEEEVEKSLDEPTSLRLAREAYIKKARGEVLSPPRAWIEVPGGVKLYCMPAYVLGARTVTTKLARVASSDPARSMPTTLATIYLFSSQTGEFMAELEGETLTAKRTAASTALATEMLANRDRSVLGIFGSGRQAMAHVPMMMQAHPFRKIIVYARDMMRLSRFAEEISKRHGIQVHCARTPKQVLESSDVIVLATSSSSPLFNGHDVRPGIHVNAIGAALPTAREVDSTLVKNSKLFVDSREQALDSYGDVAIPIREGVIDASHIRAELGDLLLEPSIFTRRHDDITLFKSGGIAGLDAVFAEYLLDGIRTKK